MDQLPPRGSPEERAGPLGDLERIDAEGGQVALRRVVPGRIDDWDWAFFQRIAHQEWRTGDWSEELAGELRRRGLDVLLGVPAAALEAAEMRARGEPPAAPIPPDATERVGSGHPEAATLDDAELRAAAREAMVRWEAWQRIRDVVFHALAERCAEPSDEAWSLDRLNRAEEKPGGAAAAASSSPAWLALARGLSEVDLRLALVACDRALAPSRICRPELPPLARALRRRVAGRLADSGVDPTSADEPPLVGGRRAARLLFRCDSGPARRDGSPVPPATIREALHLAVLWGDRGALLEAANELASSCYRRGEMKHARRMVLWSLRLARELGDRRGRGDMLSNAGAISQVAGRTRRAERCHRCAIALYREQGASIREGRALGILATMTCSRGLVDQAQTLFERSIDLLRHGANDVSLGVVLLNHGGCLLSIGRLHQARSALERALAIFERTRHADTQATVLAHLGSLHRQLGDLRQARTLLLRSLETAERAGQLMPAAATAMNLANLLLETGDERAALGHYRQALALSRRCGDRGTEAHTLANLAHHFRDQGRAWRARALYARALRIVRSTGQRRWEGAILGGVAQLSLALGERSSAQRQWRRALRILSEAGDQTRRAQVLIDAARHDLDDRARSGSDLATDLEDLRQAAEILRREGERRSLAAALFLIGAIAARTGERELARSAYAEALQTLEALLITVVVPFLRLRLAEEYGPLLETCLADLAGSLSVPTETLFDVIERTRSRVLLDRIHGRALDGGPHGLPAALRAARFGAASVLGALEIELARRRAASASHPQVMSGLSRSLEEARREHQRVCREIEFEHPRFARMAGIGEPIPLSRLKRAVLGAREALLLFRSLPHELLLLIVTPTRQETLRIDLSSASLEAEVAAILYHLSPLRAEGYQPLGHAWPLYRKLFAPLGNRLEKVDRLFIVADGSLCRIPFEILPQTAADPWSLGFGACRHLGERFEIVYSESATLLDSASSSGRDWGGPYVGFGAVSGRIDCAGRADAGARTSSLPHTRDEILSARTRFPRPTSVALLGETATCAAYHAHAPSAALLHLATHAWFDAEHPEYSGLALAPEADSAGREQSGHLQAHAIQDQALDARLVVLSACDSARGEHSASEGVLGLTRSFRIAGAESVLATLWPVEDSAARLFMQHFFQVLGDPSDRTPAEALLHARRRMLHPAAAELAENPMLSAYTHPAHWGGFVLVGTGR